MKASFAVLGTVSLLCLCLFYPIYCVDASVQYEKAIGSDFTLSARATTITQKSEYFDKYMSRVNTASLSDSCSYYWKTPRDETSRNIEILQDYQNRLHKIAALDVKSTEYQLALTQINEMKLDAADSIRGSWILQNYFLAHSDVVLLVAIALLLCVIVFWFGFAVMMDM